VNNSTYLLSCTVSETWQITVFILDVDRGCLSLTHSFGVKPYIRIAKYDLKKLEKTLHIVLCTAYFDILSRLCVTHECDVGTDRKTDGRTYMHGQTF